MKTLFMLLFTASTLITGITEIQETSTVTAKFLGIQDNQYFFAEGDKEPMAFQKVDGKVAQAINLSDEALKGQTFEVTYTTAEITDKKSGKAAKVHTIVGLKPAGK